KMKPGITGWAQINGWRGETDTLEKMEKRVEFDLEYIREWSICQLTIPESDYFIWITGEGKTVKRLSQCFEKGFDPHLVRAAAYW
ncbi:sugar transferase, partial [Salmonella enterica subsp. enterica serovar Anatum]|nr:sugar transferase [Salmonella enterica subsp. enterica serovar Anatum]